MWPWPCSSGPPRCPVWSLGGGAVTDETCAGRWLRTRTSRGSPPQSTCCWLAAGAARESPKAKSRATAGARCEGVRAALRAAPRSVREVATAVRQRRGAAAGKGRCQTGGPCRGGHGERQPLRPGYPRRGRTRRVRRLRARTRSREYEVLVGPGILDGLGAARWRAVAGRQDRGGQRRARGAALSGAGRRQLARGRLLGLASLSSRPANKQKSLGARRGALRRALRPPRDPWPGRAGRPRRWRRRRSGRASSPPPTSAVWASYRYRPRCWRRWMRRWAARSAWTSARARTTSARFTSPGVVVADLDTLATLPESDLRSGLGRGRQVRVPRRRRAVGARARVLRRSPARDAGDRGRLRPAQAQGRGAGRAGGRE